MFICQFSDVETGKLFSLVENQKKGKFVEGALPDKTSPKVINFIVHPKRPNEYTFEFEYNDERLDSLEYIAYQKFWLKHPSVLPPKGQKNPNFKNAEFIMEDLTDMRENEAELIKRKSKVYQKYTQLDAVGETRNKKNVAYHYGISNADKMNENDLLVVLVGNSGILMQEKNIDSFLKYDSGDTHIQLSINTRRAIEKGIVERKRTNNQDTFFVNNHPIGNSEDAVISYMDSNNEFYAQYIVQKLGDDAEVEKKEKKKHIAETIKVDDLEGMRKEAKEKLDILVGFGIKGAKVGRWASIQSAEKMKEAIDDADAVIEKYKAKEIVANA